MSTCAGLGGRKDRRVRCGGQYNRYDAPVFNGSALKRAGQPRPIAQPKSSGVEMDIHDSRSRRLLFTVLLFTLAVPNGIAQSSNDDKAAAGVVMSDVLKMQRTKVTR